MYKVYIAGAITDPDPLKFLDNVRKGIRVAALLMMEGYAVFCPHLDHQIFFQIQSTGEVILNEQIKNHSIEWLRVSDAVLVLPGYACSRGVHDEMKEADKLKIPIFLNPYAMRTYFDKLEEEKKK